MPKPLQTIIKEYCKVLGVCYAAMISFTAFLYLSLLIEKTPNFEIFEICLNFLLLSILTAILVVTPVFIIMYRNEQKKLKRKVKSSD